MSRFVSRSSDKCRPLFQVLKKAFHWDAQCEEAFSALKTYLSSPPILVSPSEGELLTLYLPVSDFSTSAALVRERDRIQQPVYYYSRALKGAEEWYPKMEKLILTLVTTARRLRPYFQSHTIEIPTEHPMKQILHKPETSGRLIKWALSLVSSTSDTSRGQRSKGRYWKISSWNSPPQIPRHSLLKLLNWRSPYPFGGCP